MKLLFHTYLRHWRMLPVQKAGMALLFAAVVPCLAVRAGNEKKSPAHTVQRIAAETLFLGRDTVKPSYVSQPMDGAELMKVENGNFVNALIGRLAGATINPSASGVGGPVRVVWLSFHDKIQ